MNGVACEDQFLCDEARRFKSSASKWCAAGMCWVASIGLASELDGVAVYGSMKDSSGLVHEHAWVIAGGVMGDEYIVDVTADQFGWPGVIVTSPSDSRYREKRPIDKNSLSPALAKQLRSMIRSRRFLRVNG